MIQGGRKQGGTGCWCPPTFHRSLQLFIVVYVCVTVCVTICVHVCGDSKCSTILHFTCTVKCKIHKMHDQLASYTCNFKCDHMAQKKLNFFAQERLLPLNPLSQKLQCL